MTAVTINEMFYRVAHVPEDQMLGDGHTTTNDGLEEMWIPTAVVVYLALTDANLSVTGTPGDVTFGDTSEFENTVTAYICAYLAEVDLHPSEFRGGDSPVWSSRFMQMALQLLQTRYPDRIKAKPVGGGMGLVWILDPDRRQNISLMMGTMRSNYDRGGSAIQFGAPTSTDEMLGR
jgi:hypothetical protein